MWVTEIIKRHERKYPVRKNTIEISRPTFLRGINAGGNLFPVEFRCVCGYNFARLRGSPCASRRTGVAVFYNLFMVGVIELFPRETNYDSKKIRLKNCMRRCTFLSFSHIPRTSGRAEKKINSDVKILIAICHKLSSINYNYETGINQHTWICSHGEKDIGSETRHYRIDHYCYYVQYFFSFRLQCHLFNCFCISRLARLFLPCWHIYNARLNSLHTSSTEVVVSVASAR